MRPVSRRVQVSFRFAAYNKLIAGIPGGGLTEGATMFAHWQLQRAAKAFDVARIPTMFLLSVLKACVAPVFADGERQA